MVKVTRRDVLKHARELITPQGSWIKGDLFGERAAEYADGYRKTYKPQEANCFCALGAIDRALVDLGAVREVDDWFEQAVPYTSELNKCIYNYEMRSYSEVYKFNDNKSTTHQDVLDKFDCAIELADDEKDIRE